MKNTMRVLLAASMVLAVTACKKEDAPVVEAQQALVAPAKDDDAGWRKYLQAVAVQNMGNITNNPFLYYLVPESDPEFADKYGRQVEAATTTISRGVSPGNMLAFGSSASSKMADLIETAFKGVPSLLTEASTTYATTELNDSCTATPQARPAASFFLP